MRTRRNRMTRRNTRVDFTPMVDMNMLLLTFFMFCTTLSKPQIMDVAMPAPTDNPEPNLGVSKAITFILATPNKVYYYEGLPDYENHTSLKKIKYSDVRNVLVNKNKHIVQAVNALTKKLNAKEISPDEYKKAVSEIKKDDNGAVAVIKPTDDAVYQNLVDILDEMAICSVGRYAIVDMEEGDDFLMKNYESKGLYAQGGVTK